MTPIRPELLAAKLQAIRNLEYPDLAEEIAARPRFIEVLWFIQFQSMQPGGLQRFVDQLIEQFPERFVTAGILKAGSPDEQGRYALQQCLSVWKAEMEKPWYGTRASIIPPEFHEWAELNIDHDATVDSIRRTHDQEWENIQFGLENYNYQYFARHCRQKAHYLLPDYLRSFCENHLQSSMGVGYCADLMQTLIDCMEAHARHKASDVAKTAVTDRIFHELQFAMTEKVPVVIVGESRYGKTKSVATWCKMRPGIARLVTVPPGNSERDFYAAHADAFGLSYTDHTSTSRLKREVEFVHRHSGLFCVYDEAHFLVPQNYTKTTAPRRLNWVRCEVIDRELGCAFFATPQTYNQTLDKFCKTTGYRMEQWLGRMAPPVLLTADLQWEDLIEVARKNFPEIPANLLDVICARAMQSDGYLKSIELTAKRARYLARENKHSEVTLDDIDQAIAAMMPDQCKTPAKGLRQPGRILFEGKPMADSLEAVAGNRCKVSLAVA